MVGTSAGGLATLIASKALPGIAGWVGLDPVDRTGSGLYAASKLEAPAIVLLADDSACNLFGSGRSLARAVPRLVRSTRIRGASHCDFEGPTNRTCTVICGESTAEKRAEAREAAVAATLELLAGRRRPRGRDRGATRVRAGRGPPAAEARDRRRDAPPRRARATRSRPERAAPARRSGPRDPTPSAAGYGITARVARDDASRVHAG